MSYRLTRPSPKYSATLFPEGFIGKGNDGNPWIIKINSNGIRRWVRLSNNVRYKPAPKRRPVPKRRTAPKRKTKRKTAPKRKAVSKRKSAPKRKVVSKRKSAPKRRPASKRRR